MTHSVKISLALRVYAIYECAVQNVVGLVEETDVVIGLEESTIAVKAIFHEQEFVEKMDKKHLAAFQVHKTSKLQNSSSADVEFYYTIFNDENFVHKGHASRLGWMNVTME